jgi:hypothetical protein
MNFAFEITLRLRSKNSLVTITLKMPAFREAFKRRHCIVPADWFYEWQGLDSQRKKTQSWAIARKDRKLFGMAGLWESWNDPVARQPLETFTIVTTDEGNPSRDTNSSHLATPELLTELAVSRLPFSRARKSRYLELIDLYV